MDMKNLDFGSRILLVLTLVVTMALASCRMAEFYRPATFVNSEVKEIMNKLALHYGTEQFHKLDSSQISIAHYWKPVFGWFSKLPSGKANLALRHKYQQGIPLAWELRNLAKNKIITDSVTHSTLAYFIDFPHRIQEAEIMVRLEDGLEDGAAYFRILATWQSKEANREFDQFVIWVNTKNYSIRQVDFTSRQTSKSQRISIQVQDELEVGDIRYFQKMTFSGFEKTGLWRTIEVSERQDFN